LQTGRELVEIPEAGRHPGDRFLLRRQRFELHQRPLEELADGGKRLLETVLRQTEDPLFRAIQKLVGAVSRAIRLGGDIGARQNQPPLDRGVQHQPCVVIDIGGGRHDLDDARQVFLAADLFERPHPIELFTHRERVRRVALIAEVADGGKDSPVSGMVEVLPVENLHRSIGSSLLEQHPAEN
jgi:hypothetical protein